jgi:hypothetical protein
MDDKQLPEPNHIDATTDIAAAIEAGRRLALEARPSPHGKDGLPYIVLRDADGSEFIQPLRADAPRPPQRGTAHLHDLTSFRQFWESHQMPHSRVYAQMTPEVRFTAVFNDFDDESGEGDWRDFRATYAPKHSPEWLAWRDKDRKDWPSNEALALWLEDQLPDIFSPPAEELLSIINTFRVDESHSWSNDVVLANGKIDMHYKKHVDGHATNVAGGRVAIPEIINLRLPVWAGLDADLYDVQARFRYRLREGRLTMRYELIRPHKIVEQAFREMVKTIQEVTAQRMYFGDPGFTSEGK